MVAKEFLMCGVEPAYFMSKAFKMKPDRWQRELLSAVSKKIILLCSRQAGKSTACATLALHTALFKKSALVLILSKAGRQAVETFKKIKLGLTFIKESGIGGIAHETQTSLKLSNGSEIISLPGKQESIRGFSSVSLIIIDEASQVPDDLYKSVRPMLAVSKGTLVALSTPWGKRGWFHNSWANGENWHRIMITADDCPRITPEFIQEEINEIGEWWVRQEYFCEFVDAEDQVFSHQDILDAIDYNLPAMAA
jgi:hypothetical protein